MNHDRVKINNSSIRVYTISSQTTNFIYNSAVTLYHISNVDTVSVQMSMNARKKQKSWAYTGLDFGL